MRVRFAIMWMFAINSSGGSPLIGSEVIEIINKCGSPALDGA
jgi:hypothetical protein